MIVSDHLIKIKRRQSLKDLLIQLSKLESVINGGIEIALAFSLEELRGSERTF